MTSDNRPLPRSTGPAEPCPYCEESLDRGQPYCGWCGDELDVRGVPSCPLCGVSVRNEDMFCRMCGARLCACDAHGRKS